MDRTKSIDYSIKNETIDTRIQQKDWVKKLEKFSGEKIRPCSGVVYLIIDCSGSMSDGNKMYQAKEGATSFAHKAREQNYLVGFIKFSSSAEHLFNPDEKRTDFDSRIQRLRSGEGSTDMAAAIQMATNSLIDRSETERVMCMVTDGMPDSKHATINAADKAKKAGIDIMAIGTDDADRNFLKKITTRDELAVKVSRDTFKQGIVSMAKMLPKNSRALLES